MSEKRAIRTLKKGEVFFFWNLPNGSTHGAYRMVGLEKASREWGNRYNVEKHTLKGWVPTTLLSGGSRKVSVYPAGWPGKAKKQTV